jgi:hypothetical protein
MKNLDKPEQEKLISLIRSYLEGIAKQIARIEKEIRDNPQKSEQWFNKKVSDIAFERGQTMAYETILVLLHSNLPE